MPGSGVTALAGDGEESTEPKDHEEIPDAVLQGRQERVRKPLMTSGARVIVAISITGSVLIILFALVLLAFR